MERGSGRICFGRILRYSGRAYRIMRIFVVENNQWHAGLQYFPFSCFQMAANYRKVLTNGSKYAIMLQ